MTATALQKNPVVAHRRVGDGDVLLHLESGQYHGLNPTGSLIWALIDGERTIAAIAAELGTSLADPPEELESEVARFVESLRERDLVLA